MSKCTLEPNRPFHCTIVTTEELYTPGFRKVARDLGLPYIPWRLGYRGENLIRDNWYHEGVAIYADRLIEMCTSYEGFIDGVIEI